MCIFLLAHLLAYSHQHHKSLWVYGFVTVDDACEQAAHRVFYRTLPKQRLYLLKAFDYLGVKYGQVKVRKDK